MTAPARGFPDQEFEARTSIAQSMMAKAGIAALLLTTEPEIRYYTGFLTRFWESPTRPWYVVVPAKGAPIAVIPAIGKHLMAQSWVQDIRTWHAPDYDDDGISLLTDTLAGIVPPDGIIGIADHIESHVRMPLATLRALEKSLSPRQIKGDHKITQGLRLIKSDAEIAKIQQAASIGDRAFARVREIASVGTPLSDVFRRFQMLCLEEGADWVPYLAGGAGQGGYGDVISPATEEPLCAGDVLMLDTGLVWDGYFCDFDRNYCLGAPSDAVQSAHERLIEATQVGSDAAKPGARMSDLFAIMNKVVNPDNTTADAGRLGHGLGMQLTEWPSIIPTDHTVLAPGMVLTLEPGIAMPDGKIMVHEENIVITQDGARYLSTPQNAKITVL